MRGTARGRALQLIIHGSGFKFLGGEIQGTEQHRAARLMDELKRDQRCSERSTVGARDKEEIPRRMREQVSPSLPGECASSAEGVAQDVLLLGPSSDNKLGSEFTREGGLEGC